MGKLDMVSGSELREKLYKIDHKSYPAYKELRGQYQFGEYVLSIDHVQGDPFAAPSRVSVHVPMGLAKFPGEFLEDYRKRITLQDHLTRLFYAEIHKGSFQAKGSGKSGLLTVSRCGQEVLERTACHVSAREIVMRFAVGFPANGRTICAKELEKIIFEILPDCIRKSLYYGNISAEKLKKAIDLCEDQQYIRSQLEPMGLCAFVADGSILPRMSGVSERPMADAVPFSSPEELRVTLELPNRGLVSGMGIKKGITLLVGGGYHGKSTVLQALQEGVYNHIPGDGREYVITDASAVKLRAEDGRSITDVDISPFINHLPGGRDTTHFSTEDASGSTSQAAGLVEAMESGSSLLLIDEDTSATNFMIRDGLMQKVIHPLEEPITPFLNRVRSLYEDFGISSIIVAGSSGSYFHVADTVIQMKEYVPVEITDKAKEAAGEMDGFEVEESIFPDFRMNRVLANKPFASMERRPYRGGNPKRQSSDNSDFKNSDSRVKIKTYGEKEFSINKEEIDLRSVEQLKEEEQTLGLAYALHYLFTKSFDGKKTLAEAVGELEKKLDEKGLETLFGNGEVSSFLARPRRQEIFACVNRYRM